MLYGTFLSQEKVEKISILRSVVFHNFSNRRFRQDNQRDRVVAVRDSRGRIDMIREIQEKE